MAQVQVFGERRRYIRKACAFTVTIEDKKTFYPALIRNLSLGGALVELPVQRNPRVGQRVTLTIPFRLKNEIAVIPGRIHRVNEGLMGVAFLRRTRRGLRY